METCQRAPSRLRGTSFAAARRIRKTRDRADKLGTAESNAPLFARAASWRETTRRHQTAPLAAIEAIEAAATLPFDEGCRRERAIFARVRAFGSGARRSFTRFSPSGPSRRCPAFRRTRGQPISSASRSSARGPWAAASPWPAPTPAFRSHSATSRRKRLERGLAAIRRNYESSVKRGRLSAGTVDERLGLIHTCARIRRL